MLVLGSRGMGGIKRAMWGLVRVEQCSWLAGWLDQGWRLCLAPRDRLRYIHSALPLPPSPSPRPAPLPKRRWAWAPCPITSPATPPPTWWCTRWRRQRRERPAGTPSRRRWRRGSRAAAARRHDAKRTYNAAQTLLRHFVEHAQTSLFCVLPSLLFLLEQSLHCQPHAVLARFDYTFATRIRRAGPPVQSRPHPAVMTVPARPCTIASASAMLPTAARPPVALAKRQAAATLGAMLPLANDSCCSWLQRMGEGSGRCSLGQAAGS